jgi:hypothetical protein
VELVVVTKLDQVATMGTSFAMLGVVVVLGMLVVVVVCHVV